MNKKILKMGRQNSEQRCLENYFFNPIQIGPFGGSQ